MWFERLFGNTETFAIRVSLEPDPSPAPGGDEGLRWSWGGIAIYALGRCLSRHYVHGVVHDSIRWYSLPLIQWLNSHCVRFLNEEPFPGGALTSELSDSVAWLEASLNGPVIGLTIEEEDEWFENRSRWWESHALRAALPGAVAPNLLFHRVGDDIELSWDNESVVPTKPGVRFVEPRGAVVVAGAFFTGVLRQAVHELTRAIQERVTLGNVTGPLANGGGPSRDSWKLLLQSPTRRLTDAPEFSSWREKQEAIVPTEGAFIPHTLETSLLRAVPAVTVEQVRPFLNVTPPQNDVKRELLKQSRATPAVGAEPWRQGYEAAHRIREALGWGNDAAPPLRAFLQSVGVAVHDSDLLDGVVCAVSSFGGNRIGVLANRGVTMGDSMKLGTALGHIVLDLPHEGTFGVVSSPWAHWPTTARAKAFAAMLLMPDEEIRSMSRRHGVIDSMLVRQIMQRFRTTAVATTWHLYALRMISDEARMALASEVHEGAPTSEL